MSNTIKILLIIIAIFLLVGVSLFFRYQRTSFSQEEIAEIHEIIRKAEENKCRGFLWQDRKEYEKTIRTFYFPEEAEYRIKQDWHDWASTECEILDIEFTKMQKPKGLPDRIFLMATIRIKIVDEEFGINMGKGMSLYFLKKDKEGKWRIEKDSTLIGPQDMELTAKAIIQELKEKDKK